MAISRKRSLELSETLPEDSGARRPAKNWKLNLAAAWVAQLLCAVGFSAVFPFIPFYIRDLGVTDPQQVTLWAGAISAAAALSMAVASPVWGVIADRRGRKLMVERATFGGTVVVVLMAFAGNVQQLFLLRLLQGMLTGTVPAFLALVAGFVPATHTGFALGMMQTAVYTGTSLGPMIGGFVADHLGYRWAFGVTGILLSIAGVLVYFLVEESFIPPKVHSATTGIRASGRTILRSWPVIGAMLTLGIFNVAANSLVPVLPLFVESLLRGPTLLNTTTGTIYGVRAVASAVAAALVGRLSDKAGYRSVMMLCAAGAAFAALGQGLSPTYAALLLASLASGIFTGGLLPTSNTILARSIPKEQQGTIYGVSHSVNAAGRALGPLMGAALANAWGLRASFFGAAVLFALIIAWILTVVRERPTPH